MKLKFLRHFRQFWQQVELRQTRSLKTKTTLLTIAIGTLPVLAIGGIAYYSANQSIAKQITKAEQDRLIGLQDKVNRFVFERFGDIQIMATLPMLTHSEAQQQTTQPEKIEILTRFTSIYGVYDSIAVFDLQGNPLLQTSGKPLGNHFNRSYFQAALNIQEPIIGLSTQEDEPEERDELPSLYFAAVVRQSDSGQPIGVVRSRMPLRHIDVILHNYQAEGYQFYFLNAAGDVLIRPEGSAADPAASSAALAANGSAIAQENLRQILPAIAPLLKLEKVRTQLTQNGATGTEQLVSYAPPLKLAGVPDLRWHAVGTVEADVVFAPQRKLLTTLLWGTGITAVGVGAIAIYLVDRGLIPILAAAKAVEKIGQGDLSTRLNLTGNDELTLLGSHINQMAGQIQVLLSEQMIQNEALSQSNGQLKETLDHLHHTQSQLIQSEKMSSLGEMVAGIAHEINNPVNFIHGNLNYVVKYVQDLLALIGCYQSQIGCHSPAIAQMLNQVELAFIEKDLPQIINSMQVGTDRIRKIVLSLRNFSRLDESAYKTNIDIHEGLDSTLLILNSRLSENVTAPPIQIVKEYGELPAIACYAGQLNQVFLQLLTNSIDALQEQDYGRSPLDMLQHPSQITIRTEKVEDDRILIQVIDTGAGIPEAIQQRIYDPFFTTKPVGKGTGIGLTICYQIITEGHGGRIECFSEPGAGTAFWIELPTAMSDDLMTIALPMPAL